MAISALGNRAGMSSSTTGTGSAIALGTALGAVAANICSYEDFSTAGITNGQQVTYLLLDNNGNWEVGNATYNSSGPQLTSRTVITGSSGGSPINLTGNQQVFLTALKSDIGQTAVLHVDADQSSFLATANRGFGAANLQMVINPQGRITLSSGVPVMSATVSAATTIYYTPYVGSTVPIYNGTNFEHWSFAELSQATSDATKSPASVTTNSNYDIFVWSDAGTLRATRGPAWTSSTARGSGAGTTQLVLQNGVYLNAVTITNGPTASRGTYVGTVRSNGSSQIDYIFGGAAGGGTAAVLGVWNMYNRMGVTTTVADTTSTWNTNTTASYQALDQGAASSGLNNRISAIFGLAEDGIDISISIPVVTTTVLNAQAFVGFGIDSTTTPDKAGQQTSATTSANTRTTLSTRNGYAPQIGFHFWQALQAADGTNAASIVGGAVNMAFVGSMRM